ncbi:hypothetical protein AAG565_00835 [Fontimonas sp. SYSU GA230001]|uniref:hypothetical protein n=1 Tax=Fontimonas sp. SYSU GA230001 TaxID=3142450 RepID=UPI0032B3DA17
MRNILLALTTGTVVCGTSLLAAAAAPDSRQPEARAYLNFSFGGAAPASESFFYGLRIDRPLGLDEAPAERPALMAVEFDRAGFSAASINGMPFVRQLRLNQDEAAAGGTQWTAIDWGLLAAGVVGLGFVVAEVANSESESPDPAPGSTAGGATTGGGTTGGTCLPGTPLCLPYDAHDGGLGFGSTAQVIDLDGGTGYMGDLIRQ